VEIRDLFSHHDGNAAVPAPGRDDMPGDGILRITRSARAPQLVLAGEIDVSTHAALIAALAGAADGTSEIHLDLAAVDFCDVAGLRILTGHSDGGRPAPGQVILHHLPAHLNKMLRLLHWEPPHQNLYLRP
jgi:anti-anti-sigma factor